MTEDRSFNTPSVRDLAGRFLDILLPPVCVACGALVSNANALCSACWKKIDFIDDPQCRSCGRPFEFELSFDNHCGACLRSPPLFERARSAIIYGDHSRQFILSYKHGDRLDLVPSMVTWLERAGGPLIENADMISPVPLHWSRFLSRQFNQSAELARRLSQRVSRPYAPDLLERKKRTLSQAGLNARERARNVRGAFSVKPAWLPKLSGKRVLLIDDVLTTGATLNACAGILIWAGASAVDVLTVARVVQAERE